jgi:hypothetical protein
MLLDVQVFGMFRSSWLTLLTILCLLLHVRKQRTSRQNPCKITEWSIQARRIDSKVCSSMCRKSMPRNSVPSGLKSQPHCLALISYVQIGKVKKKSTHQRCNLRPLCRSNSRHLIPFLDVSKYYEINSIQQQLNENFSTIPRAWQKRRCDLEISMLQTKTNKLPSFIFWSRFNDSLTKWKTFRTDNLELKPRT